MSLKIAHLIAYECEDGLLLGIHDTHNTRDDELAAADIKRHILRHQKLMAMKNGFTRLLAGMALKGLLEDLLEQFSEPEHKPESDSLH